MPPAGAALRASSLTTRERGPHLHRGQYFQLVEYVDSGWDRHAIPDRPSCAGLGQALGGEARFASLYWLRCSGSVVVDLARQASKVGTSAFRAR